MELKQCTYLKPKQDFHFKNPQSNRMVTLRTKDIVWVMSSSTDSMRAQSAVMLGRSNASMGNGWYFSIEQVEQFFEVIR